MFAGGFLALENCRICLVAETHQTNGQKSVRGSLNAPIEIEETLSDVVIVRKNLTFLLLFVHYY